MRRTFLDETYQARLEKVTAERNIYNFRSLSQEERDVLAFNKGADLIDKPEKKKKKKKKKLKNKRSGFHSRTGVRSQSFQERNYVPVQGHHPSYQNQTEIRSVQLASSNSLLDTRSGLTRRAMSNPRREDG